MKKIFPFWDGLLKRLKIKSLIFNLLLASLALARIYYNKCTNVNIAFVVKATGDVSDSGDRRQRVTLHG